MSKILIVDDNVGICEALSMALTFGGYTVTCVANEADMLANIKESSPNLILLDMLISGEDGCDIYTSLLESRISYVPPVIIMSAHPDAEMRAKKCGAAAFLPKPFELDHLFSLVKKHARAD